MLESLFNLFPTRIYRGPTKDDYLFNYLHAQH